MSVMDEENKQQQQNSISKEIANREIEKGKQAAKDAAKNAEKKAASAAAKGLASLAGNPYFWLVVAIITVVVIIFLAASHFLVQKNQNKTTVDAKKEMMTIAGGIFEIDKTVTEYKYKFVELNQEQEDLIKRLLEKRGMNKGDLRDEDDNPIYFNEQELAILYELLYGNAEDGLDINQSAFDIRQFTEEQLHCLPLFFKAELVTMYPDLGGATIGEYNFQGKVKIKRHKSDGKEEVLTYRPKEQFDEWIENNKEDALEHFTLDEDNNLWYANKTTIIQEAEYENVDSSEQLENSTTETITAISVPYQDIIRKYTIPFEFLMPILTITEDAEFCTDIANEIIDKTEITLGIYDNITTVVSEYYENTEIYYDFNYISTMEYQYKNKDDDKITETYYNYEYYWGRKRNSRGKVTGLKDHFERDYMEEKSKIEKYTTETTTNVVAVDKANTIFFDMEQSFNSGNPEPEINTQTPQETVVDYEDKEKFVETQYYGIRDIKIENEIEKKFNTVIKSLLKTRNTRNILIDNKTDLKTTDDGTYVDKYLGREIINNSTTTTVTRLEYQKNDDTEATFVNFKGKDAEYGFYQRFIKDDVETKHTRSCLLEVKNRLFTMLEENLSDSETYINIMKYIFYLFTGKDYGVTNIDDLLELYEGDSYIPGYAGVSGNALYDYMRIWENTELYKYYAGETKTPPTRFVDSDGKHYKVFYGGSSDPTYNLAYGIVISRDYNDSYFSAKGVNSARLRSYQSETAFTDLTGEQIERIFENMIEDHRKIVLQEVNGLNLEDYQIDALTAIHYQYGNIGNFKSVYQYYKDGDKSTFQSKFTVTSGTYHPLLVNSANNKEQRISARVKANWELFDTGVYSGNGYRIDPNNYSSSAIGANIESIEGLNLYNPDGTVNQQQINILNNRLTSIVNSDVSNYNGLNYKQCTWWVAKRAGMYLSKHGTTYKTYPTNGQYGNAKEWYKKNKDNGWFEYGTKARANSIIVWSGGTYGHVAYVEAVDEKNHILYISHAGNGDQWYGVTSRPYTVKGNKDDASYGNKTMEGYIYLDSPK